MNVLDRVARSRRIAIACALLSFVLIACLAACAIDQGPDPVVVVTQSTDDIEAAADAINSALAEWERIGSDLNSTEIQGVGSDVNNAVKDARSVAASAQAEIAQLEPSELTTATLRSIAALEKFADSAEAAFSNVETMCAVNETHESITTTIGLGWDATDGFWDSFNDEKWSDASAQVDAAEAQLKAARAAAVAANEKWPNEDFAEYVPYLDKTLVLMAEYRKQVDYGRNLNRYSSTSVNRYNKQLKTIDAVNDELRDWTMPESWDDPWQTFAAIDVGIMMCETDSDKLDSAIHTTRLLLEAPEE